MCAHLINKTGCDSSLPLDLQDAVLNDCVTPFSCSTLPTCNFADCVWPLGHAPHVQYIRYQVEEGMSMLL